MNSAKLAQLGISMTIETYLGVLDTIPDLFEMLVNYKYASFHEYVVEQEAEHSGDVSILFADDKIKDKVRVKLQEKGIPFENVDASGLPKEIFHPICRNAFLIRPLDAQLGVQEVVHEIEDELEKEYAKNQELEEAKERSRDDEGPAEEEGATPEQSEDPIEEQTEEDLSDDEEVIPAQKQKSTPQKAKPSFLRKSQEDAHSYGSANQEKIREENRRRDERALEDERRQREQRLADEERKRHEQQAATRNEQERVREQDIERERRRESEVHATENERKQQEQRLTAEDYERNEQQRSIHKEQEAVREREVSREHRQENEMRDTRQADRTDTSEHLERNRYYEQTRYEQREIERGRADQERVERERDNAQKGYQKADESRYTAATSGTEHSRDNYHAAVQADGARADQNKTVDFGSRTIRSETALDQKDLEKSASTSSFHNERTGEWDVNKAATATRTTEIVSEKRTSSRETRQGSEPKTEHTSSRVIDQNDVPRVGRDSTRGGISVLGTGSVVSEPEYKTYLAAQHESSQTSEVHDPSNMRSTIAEHTQTNGDTGASVVHPAMGGVLNRSGQMDLSVRMGGFASEKETQRRTAIDSKTADSSETSRRPSDAIKVTRVRETTVAHYANPTLKKKTNTHLPKASENPEVAAAIMKALQASGKSGKKINLDEIVIVSSKDVTKDVLKVMRGNSIADVMRSGHLTGVARTARRSVTQSMIDRETDAGEVMQDTGDMAAPLGRYMLQKKLNQGAMELARSQRVTLKQYAAFDSVVNNCSIQESTKRCKKMFSKVAIQADLHGGVVDLHALEQHSGNIRKEAAEKLRQHAADMKSTAAQMAAQNGMMIGNSTRGMIQAIGRFNQEDLIRFVQAAGGSKELIDELSRHTRSALRDVNKLDMLFEKMKQPVDKELVKLLKTAEINNRYKRIGSLSRIIRGYFLQMLKRAGSATDAGRAFGQVTGTVRNVYVTYSAGMKLLLHTLQKHGALSGLNIDAVANPIGTLTGKAAEKVASRFASVSARASAKAANRTISKSTVKAGGKIGRAALHTRWQTVAHLKTNALAALNRWKFFAKWSKRFSKANSVFTKLLANLSAKAAAVAGPAIAIILAVVIGLSLLADPIKNMMGKDGADGMTNYVFVQDTEIINEIVTELTQKNETFMTQINDAKNHRGQWANTTGFAGGENTSFYESYNVVFRDAYNNELDPSHVDLNNTKAIIAMASRFFPYPFEPLSDTASEEAKKAYEDIKQHFKDYCNFLWAATHQISIEEYHPGNSEGIEGAEDNSGLVTSLDKGKCEQDRKTVWLQEDFTRNVCNEQVSAYDSELPDTGLGSTGQDLCTHGKDGNEFGGWRKTGRTRKVVNCNKSHKWGSGDNAYYESCEEGIEVDENGNVNSLHNKSGCLYTRYEWVYDCGGHMGAVVYVTIGDLSRFKDMPAAQDVDYSAVGVYADETTSAAGTTPETDSATSDPEGSTDGSGTADAAGKEE